MFVLINFQSYKTSVSHYTEIDASYLILLCLFVTSIDGNNVISNNGQRYLAKCFEWAIIYSDIDYSNHLCYINSAPLDVFQVDN